MQRLLALLICCSFVLVAGAAVADEPPAAADPDETLAPATTASSETPPLPTTNGAPSAQHTTGLVDDAAADAEVAACNAQLEREGDNVLVRDCFLRVVAARRGTVAALRAETSLTILELQQKTVAAEDDGVTIPAGRLGVTTVAGLFGVWNGIAGGAIVSANAPELQGSGLIAGTGAAAVVLGIGMGAGGYFLADRLALDEGAARMLASSIVWGSVVGVGLAPMIVDAFIDSTAATVTAGFGSVVAAGYVGAGAGLLITSLTKLDEAQVSMMNSGGIIGATVGLALLPNLGEARVSGAAPYSLAFSGATVAGLAGGALLGRSFDLTWGESLLCDLGLVLGGVVGGTASLVLGASGVRSVLIESALPVVGVIGGYGAGLGFVTQWRQGRGAPIWRDAPTLRPVATVVSSGDGVVATWGLAGSM